MSSIAFVGAGPTTLYALNALLSAPVRGVRITVFEAQAAAGVGSPYRSGWNDPAMLSNIASAEIPPVTGTLMGWIHGRTADELKAWGVALAGFDDRSFVPRVVLGRYFEDQFSRLIDRARAAGVAITVRAGGRVVDAVNRPDGIELTLCDASGGDAKTEMFDHVVLATGHQWACRRTGCFA